MNENILAALTGFVSQVLPEVVLGLAACVLFLGSTWKASRKLWGTAALLGLAAAAAALAWVIASQATLEAQVAGQAPEALDKVRAILYAAPLQLTKLGLFFKVVALAAGAILVLLGWNDPSDEHAGEYHGCLLLIVAGTSLVGSANDLITLFLALELISIPTYILLYLPRATPPAQEAAMKYFLLSIFSSALLLFGFSYLYGVTGTTNIPAIIEALTRGRVEIAEVDPTAGAAARVAASWQGLTLVALVMIVAGLGFRITAVPFHFYAPDVYQGTTAPAAALLAFIPKIAGFAALLRLLGLVPPVLLPANWPDARLGQAMGEQVPVLLWIMAAVTMSLGNVLALLQDNVKRLLAYSSVAHAGYMLIGLAVAPRLQAGAAGSEVGGVEALLFYLIAYGAMTVGAFAVLHYLESPERRVDTVDDLAGLGRTHPGVALLMVLFLCSLIGLPLTAGFAGKFMLFWDAMGLSGPEKVTTMSEQVRLYRILALIGVLNAAVGGWYYIRVIAVMYLREAIEPLPRVRFAPALASIWACALLTLGLGVYPAPLVQAIRSSIPRSTPDTRPALAPGPGKAVAQQ